MTNQDEILFLRTCKPGGVSHDGFVWPLVVGARTRCPDPDPNPERDCGGGLHGLPFGEGAGELLDWSPDAVWLVFAAQASECVLFEDKGRAWGEVEIRHVGTRDGATQYLIDQGYGHRAIIGASRTSSGSYSRAASSGDHSQAVSSSHYSQAASSGYRSRAASRGDYSRAASSGDFSRAVSNGDHSQAASSGDYSWVMSSGKYSWAASSGDHSWAASSGTCSIAAVAGLNGRAAAGPNGAFSLPYWDGERIRIAVGIIGENAKPDTWYSVDSKGNLIEGEPVTSLGVENERQV